MRSAAAAERARVQREIERLEAREHDLAGEVARIRATRQELLQQLGMLERFAPEATQPVALRATGGPLRVVEPDAGAEEHLGVLRGARIREAAVRALAETAHAEAPIHYKTWFELLRSQGLTPAGKDPLATFLTQVGRSPVVKRSTAAGTYSLDLGFPQRARERLAALRAELKSVAEVSPRADVDAIAAARARRAELSTAIDATERALEEALRSLDAVEQPGAA